jgi:hypothetical protein
MPSTVTWQAALAWVTLGSCVGFGWDVAGKVLAWKVFQKTIG